MTSHSLTIHQQAALTAFRTFLTTPEEPVFLLRGYAGTGKTFLLARLIEEVKGRGETPILLAPTGRAARVMSEKAGLDAFTIHKGIYAFDRLNRVKADETTVEEKSFKYFFDLRANQDAAGTVYFVDEASMVSDAFSESEFFRLGTGHVLSDLLRYVAPNPQNRHKLVFIGDGAQLPPVGDAISRALSAAELANRLPLSAPIRETELTEVVRQAAGSTILTNATVLRDALRAGRFASLTFQRAADVADVPPGQLLDLYCRAGGGPQGALDGAIIVAYANRTAHDYNTQIREHFFPGRADVQPGDRLIVTQNNYLGDYPLFNGEFATVLSVGEAQTRFVSVIINKERVRVPLTWRQARLRVQDTSGRTVELDRMLLDSLLTSRNRDLMAEEQRALYVDAVMRFREQFRLSEKVDEFKAFLKQDPWFNALRVKYGYAITCHKAQGGTWQTAFVDFNGFTGRVNEAYFRWTYTAITRAARQLYLLNEGGFRPWDKLHLSETVPPPIDLIPLPAEALTQLGFAADDAEEVRLGLTGRPELARQLYRLTRELLDSAGIVVAGVQSANYQECYTLQRGAEMGQVQVWYNGKGERTRITPTGKASALATEAVELLKQPAIQVLRPLALPSDLPEVVVDFHDLLAEKCAGAGISPLALKSKGYAHKYHLQDDSGAVVLALYHNDKGQVSSAHIEQQTSPTLASKVRQLLSEIIAA